ncbi:MAG: LytTR family DNA-binding domain-containing protein [Bacteroidota bacterium]
MTQIKAIIVDDEPAAISNLKWELESFCEGVEVVDAFSSPVEAISGINYLKPDCVFLDIEMPEKDGFTLLSELKFKRFQLIITTAYENYALQAFRENAIDYLLKPVDTDELKHAINKIKSMKGTVDMSEQIKSVLQSTIRQQNTIQRISFAVDGKILLLKPGEIMYCKSDGNYTEIYQAHSKTIVVSKNLKEVERRISHPNFLRIHNSYLVNTDHIKEYIKGDGGFVVMDNQTQIAVSRSKKNDLMQKILNV